MEYDVPGGDVAAGETLQSVAVKLPAVLLCKTFQPFHDFRISLQNIRSLAGILFHVEKDHLDGLALVFAGHAVFAGKCQRIVRVRQMQLAGSPMEANDIMDIRKIDPRESASLDGMQLVSPIDFDFSLALLSGSSKYRSILTFPLVLASVPR